ncbi:bifunctional DNA-binding transcriptional regulator/O6-methylguanine-DNA methyltransferase Ada [Lichenibacterium ramalinae]|uniref:methylated-DNA--[protein]-cysteine S-methyltransferase n=1 Tax=Lichenibacterium ramalinae TaxID=2316527 RepID=A0A4Q2RAR7_9HYPH|nr:bifunctional DNA-binding transcriptional regulator/O6-methylguanine-DNA methyltransferase Ada [Lichenibacterium ramalinae]RYB03444.1 bifunctional DNA-binding transcriptional regulator/O6-methylguanine-DNA methyltransferase Ada [Lichenibacterium ramalinae]
MEASAMHQRAVHHDEDATRWAAVTARDAAADGRFVYAVRTTGVFCRPSCPSRPARRENVGFHPDAAAARAAGFRPCLRCRPEGESAADRQAALVDRACRLIEAAELEPDLAALARDAGLSRFHFHRVFKAALGVTPRAYAAARRAARAADALAGSETVTEAIYAGGFESSGRFYAESPARLGMTPSARRRGGAGETIRFALGQCSLGAVLVAATTRGVAAITLGDDPGALLRDLQDRFPAADLVGGDAGFEATVARVVGLVEAPRAGFDLPLDIRGTAFQERVWRVLRAIPAGETLSYAEVAARLGAPRAVRAVAGACAANALAVAIPCHRVVRTDGGLSGYRWGIARKRALLEREAGA